MCGTRTPNRREVRAATRGEYVAAAWHQAGNLERWGRRARLQAVADYSGTPSSPAEAMIERRVSQRPLWLLAFMERRAARSAVKGVR